MFCRPRTHGRAATPQPLRRHPPTRHLARTPGSLQAMLAPAVREQAQAVIATLQLQIVTRLQAEHTRAKVLNLETRTRLSHFLQAVFSGDYTAAGEVLGRFRSACTWTGASDKSVPIYTSCFATLLTQACRPDKRMPTMLDLTALVAAAERLPRRVGLAAQSPHPTRIRCLVVLVLLRKLAATPPANRIAHVNLVAYIRGLAAQFALSAEDVLAQLRALGPGLFAQFNQVFRRNERGPGPADEVHVALRNALDALRDDERSLSFDALCTFLERHSFDAAGFSPRPTAKYYEIFDSLSGQARADFLDAYLSYNHKKQLLVEDASQNVYRAVSSLRRMVGFTALHKAWIAAWLQAANGHVQRLVTSRADLEKFAFVFSYLSVEHVTSLCLTHMLSATVLAPHAKALHLASRIAWSLRKELGQADKVVFSPKNQDLVFGADHALELACSLIKILIQSCSLPESSAITSQLDELWAGRVFQFGVAHGEADMPKLWRLGTVKIHPVVAEHFRINQELFQTGEYRLPMIHPPKPWKSPRDGGFLSIRLPLVKSSEPMTSDAYMEQAHQTGQLTSVYLSVNALGACAWTINGFTLASFNALWDRPNIRALLPSLAPRLQENLPQPSRNAFPDDHSYQQALAKWKHVELENRKKSQDAQSLRIYYGMVKRLANSLATNGEIIYLPHNMDFRGRVYPAVSLLSHQNEDLVRSLLMFWEAKPLGPDGYNWLVYHLANLYNKKKMTMAELKEFVEQHKNPIRESAANPLAEDAWWVRADTPWQVLALCNELDKIWGYSGDISTFKSRIPVHQDGSCNGLQHYSALGADKEAARAVNILPDEKMQDVYTTVLGLVESRVEKDRNSAKELDQDLAREAKKVLSRKLIKQTVMTTVYGVTPYGATRQVQKQIADIAQTGSAISIPESKQLMLAKFISHHTLESISNLFAGAKLIQHWLVDNCARCIQAFDKKDYPRDENIDFFGGKHYRPMMWTSLSGFPVIQMYRKRQIRELVTPLQRLCLNDDTQLAPIDELRLKNGIAPNFIHSIDAIHLLMTCLGAKAENITFASVHDSFWTHAGEVGVLSRVIREEFARLHSSNIIENLRQDVKHINRNSHQLVWANRKHDERFVTDLVDLRKTYESTHKKLESASVG
ncbi:DNA/RNA polymerase [Metschnikowia bicuspidata var. bicuspidata NRRL YB-4993]|uniref:DNA-directed RNA polymerase n=1 Tax=Metschnikowia bicuspidata var. bicuspidata NRRL YB-4993 TaxID=869754 RepID=A0A1A0HJL3_9ASCO|nr:DNA/RNA polymerase [Metschnikowia bicuspidata var. bicuspidata NRRL YB-4993]OBA24077.1 DNA/RNA polymerase [Metschnikowia bicuspidata var. bicuspidata NRRL YB-4993]